MGASILISSLAQAHNEELLARIESTLKNLESNKSNYYYYDPVSNIHNALLACNPEDGTLDEALKLASLQGLTVDSENKNGRTLILQASNHSSFTEEERIIFIDKLLDHTQTSPLEGKHGKLFILNFAPDYTLETGMNEQLRLNIIEKMIDLSSDKRSLSHIANYLIESGIHTSLRASILELMVQAGAHIEDMNFSEILYANNLSNKAKLLLLKDHPELTSETAEHILEFSTKGWDRDFQLTEFAIDSGAQNVGPLLNSWSLQKEVKLKLIRQVLDKNISSKQAQAIFDYALTLYSLEEVVRGNILNKLLNRHGEYIITNENIRSILDSYRFSQSDKVSLALSFLKKSTAPSSIAEAIFEAATGGYYLEDDTREKLAMEAIPHIQHIKSTHFEAFSTSYPYLQPSLKTKGIHLLLKKGNIDRVTATRLVQKLALAYYPMITPELFEAITRAGVNPYEQNEHGRTLFDSVQESYNLSPEAKIILLQTLVESGAPAAEINLCTLATPLLYDNGSITPQEDTSRQAEASLKAAIEYFTQRGATILDPIDNGDTQELVENGLEYLMDHPEIVLQKKQKYLNNPPYSEEARIPQIMHHIWLTHPKRPREMRDEDIKQVIQTKEIFARGEANWEHIVWVNDLDLIPESVKTLEAEGIQVKPITLHAEGLSNYKFILQFIEAEKWGMASDTLRYSLVERFGGIYADLNFVFDRDLNYEIHHYDFFTEDYTPNGLYIDNYFFGAKVGHPIVTRMTELVARNVGPDSPQYVKNAVKWPSHYTTLATANPTYIAYLQKAHEENTIDVVYPKLSWNDDPRDRDSDASENYEYNPEDISNSYYRTLETLFSKYPSLMNTCFPMVLGQAKLNKYIHENNLCPAEELQYGHDGTNGGTWIEFGNG